MKTNRNNLGVVAQNRFLPNVKESLQICITFSLTVFAWIFFRADNISHAVQYVSSIFTNPSSFLEFSIYWNHKTGIVIILLFVLIEWLGREGEFAIEKLGLDWKKIWRLIFYIHIALLLLLFSGSKQEFIYFQF
jgi:D-alanyl-lipoteichoic acid acyltransferase DltB (MBOAT superfamily)